MKREARFAEERIIRLLVAAESVGKIREVYREHDIIEQTRYTAGAMSRADE
ncbi:MAG: hypothetical protein JRH17_10260 [Deltaproteobacteria bacterium]|nr:hypothetical protein [Deltaproteobacteria bacterium]MBW2697366.1 hypothetical protein [Deltaproteobacteria bacterium]